MSDVHDTETVQNDTATLAANMAHMAQILKELKDAQAAQALTVQNQATPSGTQNGQNKMSLFARKNEEFGKLGGTSFSGEGGPIAADNWLQGCKAIFAEMEIEDSVKQKLATHRLDGRARFWWQGIYKGLEKKDVQGLEKREVSWKEFKTMFKDEYIPFDAKARLIDEFSNLKQGSMTVHEYLAKFQELSRYAPYLIDTPYKKNKKFQDGLHPSLSHELIPSIKLPFNEFVGYAAQYEASRTSMYARRNAQKTKWSEETAEKSGGSSNFRKGKKAKFFKGKQNRGNGQKAFSNPTPLQSRPPVPQLTAASNQQSGKAPAKVCFNCGQAGHFQNQCPAPKKAESQKSSAGVECFKCGKKGHVRRNCPENRGQAYAIVPSNQNVQVRAYSQVSESENQ